MRRCNWPRILTLGLMVLGLPSDGIAQARIQEFFKETVKEQASGAGDHVLFLRRDPVVAVAIGFEQDQLDRMSSTVAILAKASSLPLTFAKKDANLILIRASDTHRGSKLNSEVLQSYGLRSDSIAVMSEDRVWGSGCGIYNFRNANGSISTSVGIVDTALSRDEQADCSSFIIAVAFGFALGLQDGTSLPRDFNVFRSAYLISVVSKCDRVNQQKPIDYVKKCIASELRKYSRSDVEAWISTNVNGAGEDDIFIRTTPVVLGYSGFDQNSASLIEDTVALFSEASSLSASVSAKDANLVILRAENISIGDTLRVEALADYSLPKEIIQKLGQLTGWSRGCGVYVFAAKDGRVSTSIGIVEKRLPPRDEHNCFSFIISASFGVKFSSKTVVKDENFPYLVSYLLTHISRCARESGNENKKVECIGKRFVDLD